MELRLQSKQTITIQVSDDCTLHTLKQTLLRTLGSSLPPDSVHLSLDRNDNLEESLPPENSLQSLGINSGDLVYFTFNRTIERSRGIDLDLENLEPIGVVPKNCPKSILLSRVMKEHLGDGRNAYKLLTIAVHAVLLDSRLLPIDRFNIPKDWPSSPDKIIVGYTLGEPNTINEGVMVKFESKLYSVIVYESIDFGRGSNVYSATLDVTTFALNLDSIWANSMSPNKIIDENEWNNIERKMCELWKVVKDGLVLPMFKMLPIDVVLRIIMALSGADIGKLQCVSKELCKLGNDEDLWKFKFKQEFPFEDDPQNEEWKKKFEECHKNRMKIIPPQVQLDVVHRGGSGISGLLRLPKQNIIPSNPGYYRYAREPVQHALLPYRNRRERNDLNPRLQYQEREGGQNALIRHLPLQWNGQLRNIFNLHHGLQGRGRGRELEDEGEGDE